MPVLVTQASDPTRRFTEFIPRKGWAPLLFAWLFITMAPTCQSWLALRHFDPISRYGEISIVHPFQPLANAPPYQAIGNPVALNKSEVQMSDEAKRYALDKAVEHNSSLPDPGIRRRWTAAILTAYEPFHRRHFLSSWVTGIATSPGYFALLRLLR